MKRASEQNHIIREVLIRDTISQYQIQNREASFDALPLEEVDDFGQRLRDMSSNLQTATQRLAIATRNLYTAVEGLQSVARKKRQPRI
ncbi:MAG: hypothetical protein LBG93_10200 [Treponema sp.]|jgi:hypothetical protein|nr:hypothetical protein [Treponema sp.]